MFSAALREAIQGAQQVRINLLDRQTAIANLVFVHQVIVASESLMESALAKLSGIADFDNQYRSYLRSHLEEERGHAEWLARDLKQNGVNVAMQPLSHIAVDMVGSQYYLVNHIHPAALLGYMAVLEGTPMPLGVVEELEAVHGTSLFRTLRFHAEHDVKHGADVYSFVDQVPPELQHVILYSATKTAMYQAEQSRILADISSTRQ